MIRIHSQTQLILDGFEAPFERSLYKNNRWLKLSACIPWDELANAYYQSFNSNTGRPVKDARLVIGAVIIKHRLKLSDEETVAQIQENPYLSSEAWINSIFFAMNLLVLLRHFFVLEIVQLYQQFLRMFVTKNNTDLYVASQINHERLFEFLASELLSELYLRS